MPDITEYEKTLTDLYNTNGRAGLHQYFVNQDGMTDDEAEAHIDTLTISEIQTPTGLKTVVTEHPLSDIELAQVKDAGDIIVLHNVHFEESAPVKTEKMTVTFADGSTKEIDVAEDGTVVTPLSSEEKTHIDNLPAEEKTSWIDRLFGKK